MKDNVLVIGVGMVKFVERGMHEPCELMAEKAILAAVSDAGIEFGEVQQVYGSHPFGNSVSGQAVLYRFGMSSIPVVKVNDSTTTGRRVGDLYTLSDPPVSHAMLPRR